MIPMKKYGRTLTDRPDGRKTFDEIHSTYQPPFVLDFTDVISMGSSYGDEVLVKLARLQGDKIVVVNVNAGIRNCIERVIEGTGIVVSYESRTRTEG